MAESITVVEEYRELAEQFHHYANDAFARKWFKVSRNLAERAKLYKDMAEALTQAETSRSQTI